MCVNSNVLWHCWAPIVGCSNICNELFQPERTLNQMLKWRCLISAQKMLDLVYVYIFGNFYFHDSIFLVNYTDCITICNDRGMKLPNANDNDFVLRQLESQFGLQFEKEIFTTWNETSNRTPNENFLAYFIGSFKIPVHTSVSSFFKVNSYQRKKWSLNTMPHDCISSIAWYKVTTFPFWYWIIHKEMTVMKWLKTRKTWTKRPNHGRISSSFKTQNMIFKKINGHQLETK